MATCGFGIGRSTPFGLGSGLVRAEEAGALVGRGATGSSVGISLAGTFGVVVSTISVVSLIRIGAIVSTSACDAMPMAGFSPSLSWCPSGLAYSWGAIFALEERSSASYGA